MYHDNSPRKVFREFMSQLFFLFIGLAIGFWIGNKSPRLENKKPVQQRRILTALERHKAKIGYESDADRIRELNLLSQNESKFLRILQHEFIDNEVVVKNKRFFIIDKDKYPLAIFEYRDGKEGLKVTDIEDGLPLFLYKRILSSNAVREDAVSIFNR